MPQTAQQPIFTTRGNQPLITIPIEENGEELVYYFNSYKEADTFTKKHNSIQKALESAGSWSDLDFEEMLDELDRMRHETKPTPLFDPNK